METHRTPMVSEPLAVGVDVGGTKLAVTWRVNGAAGEVITKPTTREGPQALVEQIIATVNALSDPLGPVAALGVSVAGEITYRDGVVLTASNLPLQEPMPLRQILSDRLQVPVFLDNDGNCAAMAEAEVADLGANAHIVVLTLGTGVGGGVICNGNLIRGRTGLAGELGHLVVSPDGPRCFGSCPGRGCLEALCSGTALARDAKAAAQRDQAGSLARILHGGHAPRAEDVVTCARLGDRQARALLNQLGSWLGVGLSSIIHIFEPAEIAIGGGLADAADLFLDTAIQEAASRTAATHWERVSIILSRAGPQASAAGAAIMAHRALRSASNGLRPDRATTHPTATGV